MEASEEERTQWTGCWWKKKTRERGGRGWLRTGRGRFVAGSAFSSTHFALRPHEARFSLIVWCFIAVAASRQNRCTSGFLGRFYMWSESGLETSRRHQLIPQSVIKALYHLHGSLLCLRWLICCPSCSQLWNIVAIQISADFTASVAGWNWKRKWWETCQHPASFWAITSSLTYICDVGVLIKSQSLRFVVGCF